MEYPKVVARSPCALPLPLRASVPLILTDISMRVCKFGVSAPQQLEYRECAPPSYPPFSVCRHRSLGCSVIYAPNSITSG